MNPLFLYNTETKSKERFIPLQGRKVTLYTCGPTVYNFAHIGNFRTYVFEDLLRRTLLYFGYDLCHVMNITDVDDKTIAGAIANDETLSEFTDPYTEAFFEDLQTLHIQEAEHYPRATDFISKMIQMIECLVEKGVAYVGSDGSVYYSIGSFPSYGRLSHLDICHLKAGASERVGSDEYDKEHIADFVLWKAYDPERDGSIYWESPFGNGRPGWHIECSAMASSLLGHTIDIHVGGVDNMFPHHENEIAQSEACFGTQFVRMWLHAEHLLVDHKKMSKSLGNFYTLRDLIALGYSGTEVRFMLMSAHYRTQLNFTMAGLAAARSSLERLSSFVFRLESLSKEKTTPPSEKEHQVDLIMQETRSLFRAALADDLNISVALASIFDFVRKINGLIDERGISKKEATDVLHFLKECNQVLGIFSFDKVKEICLAPELLEALERREAARKAKRWVDADKERDYLASQGYLIEDTPLGPRLTPRSS